MGKNACGLMINCKIALCHSSFACCVAATARCKGILQYVGEKKTKGY